MKPTETQSRNYSSKRGSNAGPSSPQIQFLEKVVALVVDDNKCREILDLDAPDRLHSEFGIFHGIDFLDAMLGEIRRHATDRAEVKASVFFAGVAHCRRAVALGDRHHGASRGLELLDEGIHSPRCRRPEGAGSIALRRLRRASVINRMVLEINRQPLAGFQALAQLR